MIKMCSQCQSEFLETSIQFNSRQKNLHDPICKSCNRIVKADKRHQARMSSKIPIEKDDKSLFYQSLLLKKCYGRISTPLLMRNLKIEADKAEELVNLVNSQT